MYQVCPIQVSGTTVAAHHPCRVMPTRSGHCNKASVHSLVTPHPLELLPLERRLDVVSDGQRQLRCGCDDVRGPNESVPPR